MHCTRHRVFLATLIVAAKYLNDSSPKNKHWARYASLFSLAEVSLMEKQLLYLLDYDLRMTEDELVFHFQPFMRPSREQSFSGVHRPTLAHRMPSLESCTGSSPATSPYPVTPRRGSRSGYLNQDAQLNKHGVSSYLPTPSPSPVRRSSHNNIASSSPYARPQPRRLSPSSSSDEEMDYRTEEQAVLEQAQRRQLSRPSMATIQANMRRGSAPATNLEHQQQSQHFSQQKLDLPFTQNELPAVSRSTAPTLRTKTSSSNLIASMKGYWKTLNQHQRDLEQDHIVVEGGVAIVQQ